MIAERAVAEARGWIGTPYRHQASLKGVGCDCLGLVTGVWRALYGTAPVHLRAVRTGDGIALRWIRRTRIGGDAWAADEVPLGEEREAYRVEIIGGGVPVRTFACQEPACLYANADEWADFGQRQTRLSVRVMQMSASVGAGRAAEGVFNV